jgi:hypothetical protein
VTVADLYDFVRDFQPLIAASAAIIAACIAFLTSVIVAKLNFHNTYRLEVRKQQLAEQELRRQQVAFANALLVSITDAEWELRRLDRDEADETLTLERDEGQRRRQVTNMDSRLPTVMASSWQEKALLSLEIQTALQRFHVEVRRLRERLQSYEDDPDGWRYVCGRTRSAHAAAARVKRHLEAYLGTLGVKDAEEIVQLVRNVPINLRVRTAESARASPSASSNELPSKLP